MSWLIEGEGRWGTLRRRLITLPSLAILFVAGWLLSPILLAAALLVDLVRWSRHRTPFMALRLLTFLLVYLAAEVAGVISLFFGWIASGFGTNRRWLEGTAFAIQRAWAGVLFATVRRLFSLTITVEGIDATVSTPFLLVARHASIVDNLLPAQFISRPNAIHIRYVMKRELLIDPALDIAGNRLPNYFVTRRGGEREAAGIGELAAAMTPHEGLLIYPEGTRFSEVKLERVRKRLSGRDHPSSRLATSLRSVLPPRPAGVLAMLEATSADVVMMAHRGLDGFARIADVWRGAMVRVPVDVRLWRIPRSEIPAGRSARTEWLYRTWKELDNWVANEVVAPPTGVAEA